jgi:hypothetical protein
MCDLGEQSGVPAGRPGSAGEALDMVLAGMRWLADADMGEVPVAVRAECLRRLEAVKSVQTAANASVLAAFDRDNGYADDGQGTARAWLRWQTRVTAGAAAGAVGWMRRLRVHPEIAEALRDARISASWAKEMCRLTDRLPESARRDADKILLGAADDGAELADLAALVEEMRRRLAEPDEDGHRGFKDRRLRLETTFEGAGRIEGDLTPQCAEAVQGVLDALGKKQGPADDRTQEQRNHDALLEACRLLAGAGYLPDRAGQPTQIQVHITLEELLRRLGESSGDRDKAGSGAAVPPGWPLAAPGDECDASIVPIVSGCLDHELLAKLVAELNASGRLSDRAADGTARISLNPDSVRDLIIANAAALFSGPRALASWLRRRELSGPAASISLTLDTGQSTETIPAHLRRAVIARDRHCAAPGCDHPPARCQVHHVVPRRRGGITKLSNLVLLCSFHHLIAIHTWGWTITLNADGTTTMTSPDGRRVFHSHSPPQAAA